MKQPTKTYTVSVGDTQLRAVSHEYSIYIGAEGSNGSAAQHPVPLQEQQELRRFIGTLADGTDVPVYVEKGEEEHEYTVYVRGEAITVRLTTHRDERLGVLRKSAAVGRSAAQMIAAPMPGLIKQVLVAEGDRVARGKSLCILEAMKMENEIKSPGEFVVQRILVQAGVAVEKGTKMLELAPIPEAASS